MTIDPPKAFTRALVEQERLVKRTEKRATAFSVALWIVSLVGIFFLLVNTFKGNSYLDKLKRMKQCPPLLFILAPAACIPEIFCLWMNDKIPKKVQQRKYALERAKNTFAKLQETTNIEELLGVFNYRGEETLLILEEFQMSILTETERNSLLEKVQERREWQAEVWATEGQQRKIQQGLLDQFDEGNQHLIAWVQERIKLPTDTTQDPFYPQGALQPNRKLYKS